ncbi:hypothetical protein WG66_014481 [Moniliophthora roreri]|nr:hypothetical protein WG66_014481 [Moniliophthora roreri]
MKLSASLSLVLAAVVTVTASDDHSWQAPGPNDLRNGYHIEPAALILAAKVGLTTSPEPETFTLDNLKQHRVIEHDASLSRQDFAIGDNLHFNEAIFETLANSNPGSNVYNVTSAGQVQQARLADSLARNPNVTNSQTEFGIRSFESALYLSVMGNGSAGVAPKSFVQTFFREERLPIEEGWKRPSSPIEVASLDQVADLIAQGSNWNATDECFTIPLGSGA